MKKLLLLLLPVVVLAQGQAVNQSAAPPPDNYVSYYGYTGTTLIYECRAQAQQPQGQSGAYWSVASSTVTNIVVASNVGTITFSSTTYLWVGATLTITGSTTTALNGTYTITGTSGSTATIATSGVSDGTYTTGITISTRSPLLNAAVWAIAEYKYVSSNLVNRYWAGTPGPTISMKLACTNAANY